MAAVDVYELFVVILFAAAIVLVSLWAIFSGWRTYKNIRKRNKPSVVDSFGVLAGIGVLACVIYGTFIEPYQLETSFWTIQSNKLKASPNASIRVVHISDLHCDAEPRVEPRLAPTIKALKPDVIVFSGDCINCREGLPIFRTCLNQLSKIAPTFVSMGNHDARQWPDVDILGKSSVINLNGQIEKLNLHGLPVCVTGVSVDKESAGINTLKQLSKDNLNIYVYHYPFAADALSNFNIDLLCTGHTHGGQVRLPLYGAIVTSCPTGKRFEAGMYHVKNTWMSVTRGIGMEGSLAPRVRFLCAPEITVIDITGTKNRIVSSPRNQKI